MHYLYLSLKEKVQIVGKKSIQLEDVADVKSTDDLEQVYSQIVLMTVPKDVENGDNYCISGFEIIRKILKQYPEVTIQSVGEKNVIIDYYHEVKQKNKLIDLLKIISISVILFCGGAIAIMTFQTDAALPDVFDELYEILLGSKTLKPYLIEVPYAIGIVVGITVFFNHVFAYKITKDPTPIEVEMRSYELDVNKCILNNSQQRNNGDGSN